MNRKTILQHIKKNITKVSPGAKIILFGSVARGEARPESDIDLLILADSEDLSYNDRTAITDSLYDIELETGILISPLVYTQKQWDNRPFNTPFYINIINEGKRI